MDTDIPYLLACAGAVLVMVLFWAYYILDVRKEPRSEEWYDSGGVDGGAKDGPLFLYPYGSLFFGVSGIGGLVDSLNPPEFVYTVLTFLLMAALILCFIAVTGVFGVPLPWPFVPKWVVDIRKAKRARRRERRQARKRESQE